MGQSWIRAAPLPDATGGEGSEAASRGAGPASPPPHPAARTALSASRMARRPTRPPYFEPVRAMVLDAPGRPLRAADVPIPEAGPGQRRLRVKACGVCRTDLHLRDGEVDVPHPPRIL